MKHKKFPIGIGIYRDNQFFQKNNNISNFFGFLYVTVTPSEMYFPVLPLKPQEGIIYPNGTFNGV
jgi:hypothetical protein